MKSKIFKLNIKDLVLGAAMAFIGALLTALYDLLSTGIFPTTWLEIKPTVLVGAASMLAYLIKNLFTNSQGKILKGEPDAKRY